MPDFNLSPLAHYLSLAGAATIGGLAYASAAAAAPGGAYYRAELVGAASEARFVARDVVWACKGGSCIASRGSSRPLIMCLALVKKAGAVSSFTADGKALEADELARCNGAK